jgi:NAD(P)-dependent dehydrogenase (short-subunit alcohol dehydrogenase family)
VAQTRQASNADLFDLSGRVAVVLGGTGVLGGAMCHGLARAGAAVAVLGRSYERAVARVEALRETGATAAAVVVDATDVRALEAARHEVEDQLGRVDVLLNAPGMNGSMPLFEIDLEEWHRILDANLTAVFLACQVFARGIVERGEGGSIIDISSASSGPPLSGWPPTLYRKPASTT